MKNYVKRDNRRRGFSMLEAVIAMTVAAIVTATGASIMASSQSSMVNSQRMVDAANDIANITECFKWTIGESGSVSDFKNSVEFALGLTGGDFSPTGEEETEYELARDGYEITVVVDTAGKKVSSKAVDADGKTIYELDYDGGK